MLFEYWVCQWWQAQVTQSAQVCGRCSTRLRCTASSTSKGWVPANRSVRSTNLGSLSGIEEDRGQDYTSAAGVGSRAILFSPWKTSPHGKLVPTPNNTRPEQPLIHVKSVPGAKYYCDEESGRDALAGGQG